ncbi:MAG: restriction endonuclease subunit S, partial [Clostridia bacterium]
MRLGDVCTVVSGSTPKTENPEFWGGDIDWITPAEITDETYIIESSVRKITKKAVAKTGLSPFPAGTVILSSRAPIGKVAIAGKTMYCNQGFKNLICGLEIRNEFLYWFLRGNTDYLNSLGRGATFKEISKTIVEGIEISLPTLAEQEKCARTLRKVTDIICACKQQLFALDT